MNRDNIRRLHADLLQGLEIRDLSDKALLKLGGTLLKQFRGAKAILRRLEPHEYHKASHWVAVKEVCSIEIDNLLKELEGRMTEQLDEFSDGLIINFVDLVGNINQALVDEERLDNRDVVPTEEKVELIFE